MLNLVKHEYSLFKQDITHKKVFKDWLKIIFVGNSGSSRFRLLTSQGAVVVIGFVLIGSLHRFSVRFSLRQETLGVGCNEHYKWIIAYYQVFIVLFYRQRFGPRAWYYFWESTFSDSQIIIFFHFRSHSLGLFVHIQSENINFRGVGSADPGFPRGSDTNSINWDGNLCVIIKANFAPNCMKIKKKFNPVEEGAAFSLKSAMTKTIVLFIEQKKKKKKKTLTTKV